MFKNIFAGVIALVLAFFVIKLVLWLVGVIFSVTIWIVFIALGLAIAAPIYLYIRNKLLSE